MATQLENQEPKETESASALQEENLVDAEKEQVALDEAPSALEDVKDETQDVAASVSQEEDDDLGLECELDDDGSDEDQSQGQSQEQGEQHNDEATSEALSDANPLDLDPSDKEQGQEDGTVHVSSRTWKERSEFENALNECVTISKSKVCVCALKSMLCMHVACCVSDRGGD